MVLPVFPERAACGSPEVWSYSYREVFPGVISPPGIFSFSCSPEFSLRKLYKIVNKYINKYMGMPLLFPLPSPPSWKLRTLFRSSCSAYFLLAGSQKSPACLPCVDDNLIGFELLVNI